MDRRASRKRVGPDAVADRKGGRLRREARVGPAHEAVNGDPIADVRGEGDGGRHGRGVRIDAQTVQPVAAGCVERDRSAVADRPVRDGRGGESIFEGQGLPQPGDRRLYQQPRVRPRASRRTAGACPPFQGHRGRVAPAPRHERRRGRQPRAQLQRHPHPGAFSATAPRASTTNGGRSAGTCGNRPSMTSTTP